MMPQREAGLSIDEQAGSTYGGYEGNQAEAHQQFETPYQQPLQAAKIYVPSNKNMIVLIALGMAMVTLIALAVICLIFIRDTGGWISFCSAALAIFLMVSVAIDRIK